MAHLTSQVSFPMFTNIPEDVITNTWHWQTDALSTDAAAVLIGTRLDAFYTELFANNPYAASYVLWANGLVKVYDLADPIPRLPSIAAVPVTAFTPGASTIPTEVAMVLSYKAAAESGTPAGRLRNRVYIGGLNNAAFTAGSASLYPTLNTAFRNQAATALQNLVLANGAGLDLVQRSSVGLIASRPIVGGWIDNTPDTQRRRGVKSTSRVTWSV